MSPRDLVYVGTCSTRRGRRPTAHGLSREAYDADENRRLALIHLIQVIGEAAPHDYLGVDEDIVWQVVIEDLPKLVSALEPLVPPAS